MKIELTRLSSVKSSDIIDLMNHPLVRRQMPLFDGEFKPRDCDSFVAAKEKLWADFGFGPWAFLVDGQFAGWGGLQPEEGDADLALVLHPDFWGCGKAIYNKILQQAFGPMGLGSITLLLPTTRVRVSGVIGLGFKEEGIVTIKGHPFKKFRLNKSN
ncbi:GNAT family N-acetyltransferase [Flagellimonas beolgyonensis]|jgi:GNAT superfamily N-acetyltransferase|uniref:GNAT family N-acetyltransferase n=1 Tax=Flagellimonas beolgyonensis TaxID=864064 RepID=UPI0032586F9B